MDHAITDGRWSDHTIVKPYGDGEWRVSITDNGYQWWGLATTFPTERGAQMVATAIELALKDEAI